MSCVPEEESEVKDRSALFIHLDENIFRKIYRVSQKSC